MFNELNARDYLGGVLFALYREKYPVNSETKVWQVSGHDARYGFQYDESVHSIFDMSPTYTPKLVTILANQFEVWAESKDGAFYKLTFDSERNRIYACRYF